MDETMKRVQDIDKGWERLTISNDFVFCKAMLNVDLCKEVLEAILQVPIERIEYMGRQEVLDTDVQNKGVRLDMYVRDDEGTVYNVEMQSTDTYELPQRTRYYQALMALDQINRARPTQNPRAPLSFSYAGSIPSKMAAEYTCSRIPARATRPSVWGMALEPSFWLRPRRMRTTCQIV